MILFIYTLKYSELYYGPIWLKSGNDMTTFRGRLSYQLLGAVEKLRKASMSFVLVVCLSARLHGKTRLPPDGLSLNFIFEYFSKICP